MSILAQNFALGLDIGQATVKAVVLDRSGRSAAAEATGCLKFRTEGILDEAELYRELKPWLDKNGWLGYDLVASIPQYIATTQVTDFPPGSERNLEEMVAYETQQLAGLSEESFLDDYQPMPPKFGRRNPVLIGICRESVINERADSLREAGLFLTDFTISSTALAAAYTKLYPDAAKSETPQILLDVGAENTTVAIVAGGNLLYTASLMCGTDRYVQILAQQLDISLEDAERVKGEQRINPADRSSPTASAARIFENEIRNTIEQWRSEERPEIGRIQFSRVCLCGGGAHINGLDAYLSALLDCPAEIIGVPAKDGERDPLYVTAYGLALHGTGNSPFSISLAPPALQRQVHHRRRFPYLAASIVLLTLFVGILEINHYLYLRTRQSELDAVERKLARSNHTIPELEETILQIQLFERILLPYVESCGHARQLSLAIDELSNARQELQKDAPRGTNRRNESDAWLVYLADERSYHAGKNLTETDDRNGGSTGSGAYAGFRPPSGNPSGTDKSYTDATAVVIRKTVTEIEPWHSFVAAIYASRPRQHPLSKIQAFIETLRAADFLQDSMEDRVDTFQDKDVRGREDIFRPWLDSQVNLSNYRRAVIRMPVTEKYRTAWPEGEE